MRQPALAARLAAILHNAAMDLWDVATEQDAAQMWEEARARGPHGQVQVRGVFDGWESKEPQEEP